jgi:hypothetical protein
MPIFASPARGHLLAGVFCCSLSIPPPSLPNAH